MVSELSRPGVLQRTADPADRRRRIAAIAPAYAAPIGEWLSGSASAWEPSDRATVITALHAYEAVLEQAGARHRNARRD
ncbi:hypothetical protein OG440_41175 (plasmid) [Streptomyces sp. NBC_00637]|uniref:hypothetical protein n=1 Tax=Streptomyces sp. NBC_00637 TaxID=2903667 RepID=UPI002F91BAC0